MAERIIHFEVEGKAALGFDTGLSSQAFAQAKFVQFITQEGLIVYSDGKAEPWKPIGVVEHQGAAGAPLSMAIWGPDFKGERFDLLLRDETRRDEALDALRLWIEARSFAAGPQIPLWPAGVIINLTAKTILFPPEQLVLRSIEGEDAWLDGAESLVSPELSAEDAAAFSAGAILYRILSGELPFPCRPSHHRRHGIRRSGTGLLRRFR
ncbi:hypothetical protein FACS189491_00050 [Spirochaetia bacterium]|nr:hypothetical protein FACS189491_00050 [Spirochaetia bacterium]